MLFWLMNLGFAGGDGSTSPWTVQTAATTTWTVQSAESTTWTVQ